MMIIVEEVQKVNTEEVGRYLKKYKKYLHSLELRLERSPLNPISSIIFVKDDQNHTIQKWGYEIKGKTLFLLMKYRKDTELLLEYSAHLAFVDEKYLFNRTIEQILFLFFFYEQLKIVGSSFSNLIENIFKESIEDTKDSFA